MATEAVSSTTAPLTTEQAAAAIVQLINARPGSPRQDETEAIVGRAAGVSTLATAVLSEQQARLHEAIEECLAAEKALNVPDLPDDQYDAADARFTDAPICAKGTAFTSYSAIVARHASWFAGWRSRAARCSCTR